jgi:hypothetical protein
MIRTRFWISGFVAGACTLVAAVAIAQGSAPTEAAIAAAKAADAEEDRLDAIAELKLMSDFLSAQKSFSFETDYGFDSVQANGQKLEFGSTRKTTVRRPDRLRAEGTRRDGGESTLYFDGKTISVDLPGANAYVSVPKPGSLDAALDYLVDDLDTPAPLTDLIQTNLLAEVLDRIDAGMVVGEATIEGTQCFHVALRNEDIDAQIWIADGDRPLPQRVVLTYKNAEGSPQFWAQFTNWNLAAKTPDSLFEYKPPKGAEQITIGAAVDDAQQALEGEE